MSIAWTGRVMMDSAAWGDQTGSTVTFLLPAAAEGVRNPFYRYTKRRKGRAGTRFMMACQTAGESVRHALYEDEVMLAGWNDSQQKGHTVKLWLCNDGVGHPFEGVDRKTPLMVSLVELDDDNEVIDQKMRDRVERQGIKPSQRPSYGAVMLCKNPEFHQWIMRDETVKQIIREGPMVPVEKRRELLEQIAKDWMCRHLKIDSRAELDKSEELREDYHRMIYKPFMETQHLLVDHLPEKPF